MQRLMLVIGILALIVGTVLYVKSRNAGIIPHPFPGAGGKKNNLEDVDCKTNGASGDGPARTAVIKVNSSEGIERKNEGVFVCTGEMVYWEVKAGSHVQSFDVVFTKANWPFDPNSFTSPLHGVAGTPTTSQTVAKVQQGYRMQPFKYAIHIVTDNGSVVPDLDPHIIPMGP